MIKNLLVSGYRAHELNIYSQKHEGIAYIQKALTSKLIPLAEEGLEWVITPGQYGVDLWACEAVITLKEQYPDLKCSILAAHANMDEKWKDDRKEYFQHILRGIDYFGLVSKQPYQGVWQFKARDALLLRKTDGILLVYDEDAGEGSPRFMKEEALKKQQEEGYVYMSISSEDIQSIADEERLYLE
ncbi:SLOG family protein [Paenibacillus enshidis]|uniref:SLOG family protein n=1 Tax=Paenibacillus enshidis TaxID=1458439 RepID=A0ABV5AUT8_9BACL